jgi:isopentenyl diphosphate isomerase/L-lactate dehydrogenase-like FMN-dependent dehydrogenase
VNEVAEFVRREMGGAFTWDEVARYRDRWKRPLVVKGILHPADAEKALALGGRRHRGIEPRRPPGRGAAGRDRRAACGSPPRSGAAPPC